jgi:3-isopropylmalate/(R)-2-methylmalate dehydratase large subunit
VTARSAFDKIWDLHIVRELDDGSVLLHIDRHVLHELSSYQAFDGLRRHDRRVRNAELTFAVPDHILATTPGRTESTYAPGRDFVRALRSNARETGIRLFDLHDPRQGIVHVMSPELGIALPGATVVCGDSHTCTVGGIGAVAFGIGTSQLEHVLATQVIRMHKPKRMRVSLQGTLQPYVYAKDLILYLIGKLGAAAGTGYAVEYAGQVVRTMPIYGRLTLCNMAVEMGARIGFVAPDDTTIQYMHGREFAPKGSDWMVAERHWRSLVSDEDAIFEREESIDVSEVGPQITWGTSPQHVIGIDQRIPDPFKLPDPEARANALRALSYMGLKAGDQLDGLPIQYVFIGSCTNSRLPDLRAAAAVVRGQRVAQGVRAMVVPGSTSVKRAAEEEGLHRDFIRAGFEWHESACSMCGAINADKVRAGERCVATSNRNFEGRQGLNSRTHLASPAMAAAAAISGCITDIRRMGASWYAEI